MPLSPSDLTTYHLLHTAGLYAAAYKEDGDVMLVAVYLVGITTAKNGSTTPRLRACFPDSDYNHDPDEILFEPHELPTVLRYLLWPREVPAEVAAPDAPPTASPFPGAGNIDDEPDHAPSSDYSEPAV